MCKQLDDQESHQKRSDIPLQCHNSPTTTNSYLTLKTWHLQNTYHLLKSHSTEK